MEFEGLPTFLFTTLSIQEKDDKPCPLLQRTPREVRDIIYGYLLKDVSDIRYQLTPNARQLRVAGSPSYIITSVDDYALNMSCDVTFFQTCKQIYHEANVYLFERHKIHFFGSISVTNMPRDFIAGEDGEDVLDIPNIQEKQDPRKEDIAIGRISLSEQIDTYLKSGRADVAALQLARHISIDVNDPRENPTFEMLNDFRLTREQEITQLSIVCAEAFPKAQVECRIWSLNEETNNVKYLYDLAEEGVFTKNFVPYAAANYQNAESHFASIRKYHCSKTAVLDTGDTVKRDYGTGEGDWEEDEDADWENWYDGAHEGDWLV